MFMKQVVLFCGLLFCVHALVQAQPFQHAGEYMDYITKMNNGLSEKYISYLSGISHGKSARKVEKRRQEVVNSIYEARSSVQGLTPYKGDRSLKDSTVAYYKILLNVFNEDYAKIVDMEEIAEQSYDAMEAYMLAQKKAQEKLKEASKAQYEAQHQFAEKHNVTLVEGKSELGNKIKIASAVMEHYDDVYLIFFKPYKQESYLLEAVNGKDIISIEQNLNALKNFSEEGLEKLKSLKGYNGDGSLIAACRNMLYFYKEEAQKGSAITDFLLKEEFFMKTKKAFDAKPAGKRTKQDVDEYNKVVRDSNAAVKTYNEQNGKLNSRRTAELNNWNKTVKGYLDNYMPTRK
jgi:hypothetical protein